MRYTDDNITAFGVLVLGLCSIIVCELVHAAYRFLFL